jgi:hypothetical protein
MRFHLVVANGDLRLGGNQKCWPVQAQVEKAVMAAVRSADYDVRRALGAKAAMFEAMGYPIFFFRGCGDRSNRYSAAALHATPGDSDAFWVRRCGCSVLQYRRAGFDIPDRVSIYRRWVGTRSGPRRFNPGSSCRRSSHQQGNSAAPVPARRGAAHRRACRVPGACSGVVPPNRDYAHRDFVNPLGLTTSTCRYLGARGR